MFPPTALKPKDFPEIPPRPPTGCPSRKEGTPPESASDLEQEECYPQRAMTAQVADLGSLGGVSRINSAKIVDGFDGLVLMIKTLGCICAIFEAGFFYFVFRERAGRM